MGGGRPRTQLEPGQRFGRLSIIEMAPPKYGEPTKYLCRCDCGNATVVFAHTLLSGETSSCGCYKEQVISSHNFRDVPPRQLPRGVYERHGRFVALITVNDQTKYLGTFDTQEQAHLAYLEAANKYDNQ